MLNALLMVFSMVVAFSVLELGLRLYHSKVFTLASQLREAPNRIGTGPATYDAELGWVPTAGTFERSAQEAWSVNRAGLRNNGPALVSTSRPLIVAVGDSFTFGDEVRDHETWPAQLEQLLGVRVLNGGVFAYGIDQAFLRATELLDAHGPAIVILAFISDDISRAEVSYYSGWKPYFEYVNRELTLRNVPVRRGAAPAPRFGQLRRTLSYSLMLSAILRRLAPAWWFFGAVKREHNDGDRIAVDLLVRLDALARSKNAKLVVLALATNGRISGNTRAPRVIDQARQRGVDVLDLMPEVARIPADSQAMMFRARGHYAPAMNGRIAAAVAAYLKPVR